MEIRDIVISEKYTNKMGEEKRSYTKIGTLFIKQEGGELKISGKLLAAPISNGNFNAYPKKDRNQGDNSGSQPAPKDDIPSINLDDDKEIKIEDIPF